MHTVTAAESASAIGWAYRIPFNPHAEGKSMMAGMKQIPCLHEPSAKPAPPFPMARNGDLSFEENESGQATAFCRLKKMRLGKQRHFAVRGKYRVGTRKTRRFGRNCVRTSKTPRVFEENMFGRGKNFIFSLLLRWGAKKFRFLPAFALGKQKKILFFAHFCVGGAKKFLFFTHFCVGERKNFCLVSAFALGKQKKFYFLLIFALGSEKIFVWCPLSRWGSNKFLFVACFCVWARKKFYLKGKRK